MLVLSRKKNQSIIIDGNISIEILQVKGNTIRIGINAPNDVRVLRGELKPFGMAPDKGTELSQQLGHESSQRPGQKGNAAAAASPNSRSAIAHAS